MKIVVIEVAGLHLGYVGCYGNDWVGTPNLDRLAVEGVVFEWHIADQPELQTKLPWHQRSVGTGCYARPGLSAPSIELPVAPTVIRCGKLTEFASDALRALNGPERWLWFEGPSLLPPWNLDEELLDAYFDEDDVEEGLSAWTDPPLDRVKLNEAEVLQLQNTYAAAVTVFDAQLGQLLDATNLDETMLIVTAQSGLPLGEHGMIGAPQATLHDEFVHVPFLLRLPGAERGGLRVSALTQPIDLLPTILESLGHPLPLIHGQSLWPLLRGEAAAIRPYAVAARRVDGQESRLLRTLEWAFHLSADTAATPQLFVKPDDRWEVNDLYQQQSERAERMTNALRAFAEAVERPGPLIYPALDD